MIKNQFEKEEIKWSNEKNSKDNKKEG